jgi:hypothetical protein
MSLLKRFGAFTALIVAGLALASSASAATTLSTTAFAAGLGTPGAPQPVSTTLNTTIDNDGAATPMPVAQTATIAQTFPAEFANQLAGFGSCPQPSFDDEKTAPGGPEDPSVSCPANSIVGNGSTKTITKAGPSTLIGTSEKVVIVKNATTGGLSLWVSYKALGSQFSRIAPGTVSTNATGQTVITWDPTAIEPTSGPIVVKLLEFNTAYNANQTALVALEPFANTGCAAGSWAFSVVSTFIGGAPAAETANSTASCSTTPPVPGTVTIGSKTVKVSSSGKGKFKVKCGVQGPCAGKFEITPKGKKSGNKKVVLARGSYSIAAGVTGQVSFTLTGKGKSVLAKHDGNQAARLKLLPTGGTPVSGSLQLKQS